MEKSVEHLISRLRKKKSGPPVVIVSGLPRSGTSMMMRMLENGGLFPLIDNQRTADDDNPRGYYEYELVKKLPEGNVAWLPLAQGKAVKVISALLKYLPEGYSYQVLFMQRAIAEILASQRKMLYRRGEDANKVNDSDMNRYFETHLAQVSEWMSSRRDFRVMYVDYNEFIRNPHPSVEEVNKFLGGKLDTDAMLSVVDPNLYRQRF